MINSPKHKQTKTHQTNQKYHKNADQTRVNKYNETVAVSGKGSRPHTSPTCPMSRQMTVRCQNHLTAQVEFIIPWRIHLRVRLAVPNKASVAHGQAYGMWFISLACMGQGQSRNQFAWNMWLYCLNALICWVLVCRSLHAGSGFLTRWPHYHCLKSVSYH